MEPYEHFFKKLTSHAVPHRWQRDLASQDACNNLMIRIPTGFGKTLGVLGAWLWHRVHKQDDHWPRRLVWCLPMRVLVEQTENEVKNALESIGLLWRGGDHTGKVGVHLLMGGMDSGEWHLYPEECTILIGTQDMLLSRAMNRGYAAARGRWPMEFGLLNQDCLWVMDEVQLMEVGLATSAQLQAFRYDDAAKSRSVRPCFTWWMSATLQPDWLKKSPDALEMANALPESKILPFDRTGHLWDDVSKTCHVEPIKGENELARLVGEAHLAEGRGANGPTLVVVNTVKLAVAVYQVLSKDKALKGTDIRLIHSRFRPADRAPWRKAFLNRSACGPGTDRIIVATQVIEAGVDLSAGLLITELAPWASLVQRFGRCARWGGLAKVIIADHAAGKALEALAKAKAAQEKAKGGKKKPIDESAIIDTAERKVALPYMLEEIRAAREALHLLTEVSPLSLEGFEDQHPGLLSRLYPFEPSHLLLRHELDELFDTSPDLSGADIDISRFIRSGDERDLHVFWANVPEKSIPSPDLRPVRDALCAVPFLAARDWLCKDKSRKLKDAKRAWVWDYLDGLWRRVQRKDLYPGQTVLVAADCGGYDTNKGWSKDDMDPVPPVDSTPLPFGERADAAQDDESLSALFEWQTIAIHGREAARLAREIAMAVASVHADLLGLAGRWHDAGKAHEAFQNSVVGQQRPGLREIAKAPKDAWLPVSKLYPMAHNKRRAGFRHELASVLSLFGVLQRYAPDHPALLGPWRNLLEKAGFKPDSVQAPSQSKPNLLEQEILGLNADSFNLLAYLVCAHHGKVRLSWHACPADQAAADTIFRIRGIRDGDTLPSVHLAAVDSSLHELPATSLDLTPASAGLNPHTGQGWTERVLGLLEQYGPFTLAWFEALLRAADQRASRNHLPDELLSQEVTP
jgi:CRISPR-associated endonuclease/helicase Cas3